MLRRSKQMSTLPLLPLPLPFPLPLPVWLSSLVLVQGATAVFIRSWLAYSRTALLLRLLLLACTAFAFAIAALPVAFLVEQEAPATIVLPPPPAASRLLLMAACWLPLPLLLLLLAPFRPVQPKAPRPELGRLMLRRLALLRMKPFSLTGLVSFDGCCCSALSALSESAAFPL